MPIKEIAFRRPTVPIPLNRLPKVRDPAAEVALAFASAHEVLTSHKQPLRQKCRLDKVSAVVVFAENGKGFAGPTIHKVSPRPVKAVGLFEEADNLQHALRTLVMTDEPALGTHDESHDAETRCPRRHHVLVPRNVL